MTRFLKTLFILLCFLTQSGFGKTTPDTLYAEYHFRPIVKTATKIEASQRNLTASVTSIPVGQTNGFSDVLSIVQDHVPGLFLTEWGVMGFGVAGSAAGKISMRGIGGTADTHVLILRNGRPDMMGLMGCTIADEFSSEDVEKIEVIRGPSSFLYGANASAGVINIISKKMDHYGFSSRLKTGIGSYGSQDISFTHGGRGPFWQYRVTASQRKTDGHRSDSPNPYDGRFLSAHFQYKPASKLAVEWNATVANIDLTDPGTVLQPQSHDWYDIQRFGGDLTVSYQGKIGKSHAKMHGNFGAHHFADGWQSEDQLIGFMGYHHFSPAKGNESTIGIDIRQLGGWGKNETLNYAGTISVPLQEHTLQETGVYLHTRQHLNPKWIVSTGYRMDHNSQFGTIQTPKIGLVFKPSVFHAFRISGSRGYRSPSLRELYFFPTHNSSLKPDIVNNFETGWHYQPHSDFSLDLTLFYLRGDNMIQLTPGTSGYQLNNTGQFENSGYEAALHFQPIPSIYISANWSDLQKSETLVHIPRQKLNLSVQYQSGLWQVSTRWTSVRGLNSTDNAKPVSNLVKMDDFITGNVQLHYHFNHAVLQFALNNMLNETYQTLYGYPMPGRHWTAGIQYQF